MNTSEPSYSRPEPTLLLICALITVALGVAALLGWILEWPRLASFGAGWIPMAPSTALLLVFLGGATCLRARTPLSSRAYWISVAVGSLVALVALLLFVLSSLNIRLDSERLGMQITGTVNGIPVGHTSPVTAFCFLLASVSFLASLSRSAPRPWRADLAVGSAGVLLGTCFVFLLAYLFGTPLLYGSTFIPPALATVLAFITLGLALMALALRSPGLLRRLPERISQTWVPYGLLFLVLAAGIITIGYLSYRNFEERFRAEAERELSVIGELTVSNLVQWRKERLEDGGVLFKNPAFSALLRRFFDQPADVDAQRRLLGWLDKFPALSNYRQVRLLDAHGVTRLSVPDSLGPPSVAILRAASDTLRLGRVNIQDLYRNEHDQRVYLSVQVPIFDESDATRPLGVAVLSIDPADNLYPLIQRWPTPSLTAETVLLRRDGDAVLLLNDLRHQSHVALALRIPQAQTAVPAFRTALLGQTGIVEGNDYGGVPVLAYVQAVPDSAWLIVTKLDSAEVSVPLRERLWLTVALAGVLLYSTGAGALLLGWQQRVRFYRGITESAEALRASERRYRELFELSSDALLLYAGDTGQVIDANDMASVLLGYQRDELLTKRSADLSAEPEETSRVVRELNSKPGQVISVPLRLLRRKDGTVFPVEFTARSFIKDGQPVIIAAYRDITERKRSEEETAKLEAQLQQSQKMDTVGQLAGGIAHDFNNLLTVILGNQQLLEGMLEDQPEALGLLQDASKASWRGAELCQRVLAFSRRQNLSPESIAVNELVGGMEKLLRRTLGQKVEVEFDLGSDLAPIVVDSGQLENAILNLALNAHDAMPEGGTLTIRTTAFATDEHYLARHPDVPAGQYVVIEVSDTGQGMTPDVVARVFEPFFTTKEVGKGSGLGLSMVYGFLKQSDGHARIYSEPGVGTSVRLYFPATQSLSATRRLQLQLPAQADEAPVGSERILVVEDDAEVRAMMIAMLSKLGYAVWEADSGAAGLEVLRREGKNVDLLLSDVMMPGGMDGYELSQQARALLPDLKVVLMSGFARSHTRNGHRSAAGAVFLNKPFRKSDLARTLRQVLDG